MKHSECMKALSDLAGNDILAVTNLSSNARMWSALRGDRPSFYGLNMGLCLPFAVGLSLAFPKRKVLAIDEKKIVVDQSQPTLIKALKDWGFDPIPAPFLSYGPFGGSFHCATLDVRRRGPLKSYF